ncbi:MAG: glycerol-3-phosphate O-acyltransferase/dihydroxyacetone phosphate acyltransferase [Crocinitomix sp.]|jgi:glycerol-3-phosphate O-acyltransferase/dihydroxyacetone phosphate acyltransferase
MRPLYLILRILLPYVMVLFYRKSRTINGQRRFNAQTIFVCNHPSAFIDPLVAGNFQMPVLYFVTRGDIFKWWLKPVTWGSHMVPIFRKAEDGVESMDKNKDSFRYLRKVLIRKKSLVLFGEGYTDNTFIRSLKPLKKGPARIGFDTMVECDWTEDIKIQAIGLNYSHPKHFRSDVVVSFGTTIDLKDYKEIYEQSPSQAITQLTRAVQVSMQEQITYVDQKDLAPFVENLMILTRKGMNHFHHDSTIPLLERHAYSKALASKVNETYDAEADYWKNLKETVTAYFDKLKDKKINENWVSKYAENKSKKILGTLLFFLLCLPLTIAGLVHQFIPYMIIKKFVESRFKRDVFWSGVKLLLGATLSTIYNFAFIFLFYAYVYPNYWLAVAYFLIVPGITGVIAYVQINKLKNALAYKKTDDKQLAELVAERKEILTKMEEMELT